MTATELETSGISIEELSVAYELPGGRQVVALEKVSLVLGQGQRVALIGESGSGKSSLGLALAGLLPANAKIVSGRIMIGGRDLSTLNADELRQIRGSTIGMVFQDAKASFDPLRRVGRQVADSLLAHGLCGRRESIETATRLLDSVDISEPARRVRQYPHELSGGMRQRAMIASGLAAGPRFLLADEPTSALDVTTQAVVVNLLRRLTDDERTGALLITHDMGVVSRFADIVAVLYAGTLVEVGPREVVLAAPAHPYTALLLETYPRIDGPRLDRLPAIPGTVRSRDRGAVGCSFENRCPVGKGRTECIEQTPTPTRCADGQTVACHHPFELGVNTSGPSLRREHRAGPHPLDKDAQQPDRPVIVSCRGIGKVFRQRNSGDKQVVRALRDVSFDIRVGESVGIVGESGSGKTTLARILVGLETADSGEIELFGQPRRARTQGLALLGGAVQMIFQDPGDSLDPHRSVLEIVSEPLRVAEGGSAKRHVDRVTELLVSVGFDATWLGRRPAELSGGQRQRVAIARAISARPRLVVADEAVSSLDVSIRGHILNLLSDLQEQYGFACVHISHDLSIVKHVCDTVYVLHSGQIVERGVPSEVFSTPTDPYTASLIKAIPTLDVTSHRGERGGPSSGMDGASLCTSPSSQTSL